MSLKANYTPTPIIDKTRQGQPIYDAGELLDIGPCPLCGTNLYRAISPKGKSVLVELQGTAHKCPKSTLIGGQA
ncbi:MAG: hypothetical protein AAF267_01375 [Deinococcota bacterium]